MNGSFDGGNGMLGVVQFGALAELDRLLNKPGQKHTGARGCSWKQRVFVLAICVMPVALWPLAGGNGF
jgi:hypothetical protein